MHGGNPELEILLMNGEMSSLPSFHQFTSLKKLYIFSKLNVVLNFQYTFVSISLSLIVSCATHIFPPKWKKMKEETVARMID
jgi:hypothetical protein